MFENLNKKLRNYQGFTGKNFEEDNEMRKLAGGGVYGFESKGDAPLNPEATAKNDIIRQKVQNIGSYFEKQPEKLTKLDQIRNNIMRLQQEQDIIDDEARKDPRFAEDWANNTKKYERDYFEKYPEAFSRLQELDRLQQEYQQDQDSQQHLKFRALAEKLK